MHTPLSHMHTHAEKMDMLLVKRKFLGISQHLSKINLCTAQALVYLSVQVRACALSAALANAVIIIVMSRSLQVIVRYSTQREKESRQLIEDILRILTDWCICTCV